MTAPRDDISNLIDAALAGGGGLRFPGELERRFEAESGLARSRALVLRGLVGIAVVLTYLVADWLLTPDVFALAMAMHLGVVVLAGLSIMVLLRNPPPVWREAIVAAVCVLAGASTIGIMLMSQSPIRGGHQDALILVLLFLVIVERVRFPFAIVSMAAMIVIFAIAVAYGPVRDPAQIVAETIVFAGAMLLSMVAAYTLEKEARRAYLYGVRERLRSTNFENESLHDPLTGLANRRALDQTLAGFAPAAGRDLAVIVADIDHFKSYNDTLGHVAGDLCLKRIAAILASELRGGGDEAVRYGGEEFLLLLPDTDQSGAIAIAERMRATVEAAAIPHPGRPLSGIVTVSFGVSGARLGNSVGTDELIRAADTALYAAKRAGRNQVWPRPRWTTIATLPERLKDTA